MMDQREELEALRAKRLARRAELEARLATVSPPPAAGDESTLSGVVQGAKDLAGGVDASFNRSARGLNSLLPNSVAKALNKVDEFTGVGVPTEANSVPPDSAMGTTGDVAGSVLQMLGPGKGVLSGATALGKGLQATRLAKFATPAVIGLDMAGNAGVSAAMEPMDRETAGMLGAGGAGLGRVLGRVLGGVLRNDVSPQAKTLIEAGVPITPGQAVSGPEAGFIPRMLRSLEDKLTSIPLVGDVIKRGKAVATEGYNTNRINEALGPIGKVTTSGVEGLSDARILVSEGYDKVLPNIRLDPTEASGKVFDAINNLKKDIPFFDETHAKKVDDYVARFVMPLLKEASDSGTSVSGTTFKKLDSDIGALARKFNVGGLGHEPIGDALFAVQDALRSSLKGSTPEARGVLRNTEAAYAKLVPIQEAGRRAASGNFTPRQLAEQLHRSGRNIDDVTLAAKQILPDTIPDTGTAGRGIIAHALTPSGAGAGTSAGLALGGFAPAATAAALAAGLYTRPGLKAATLGVHPVVKALRNNFGAGRIAGPQGPMIPAPYNVEAVEDIIRNLSGRTTTAVARE